LTVRRPARAARFATTRWSLVVAAGEAVTPTGRSALESLCRDCWFPLYAFARRSGATPDEAQDRVQSFFAALLEKGWLRQADPERGRFRTFLLAAFRHHVSHERERERAKKRGGGVVTFSLDAAEGERRYRAEPEDSETPERLYDRRFAFAILEAALADTREVYRGDRAPVFEGLRPFLVAGEPTPSLDSAAASLGMSPAAAKMALHRLRRRYRDALRARIADTVADRAEVEDEIRHLLAAFG
jgi:RNA polymerase sigma-70 factor (ECF subfamily)